MTNQDSPGPKLPIGERPSLAARLSRPIFTLREGELQKFLDALKTRIRETPQPATTSTIKPLSDTDILYGCKEAYELFRIAEHGHKTQQGDDFEGDRELSDAEKRFIAGIIDDQFGKHSPFSYHLFESIAGPHAFLTAATAIRAFEGANETLKDYLVTPEQNRASYARYLRNFIITDEFIDRRTDAVKEMIDLAYAIGKDHFLLPDQDNRKLLEDNFGRGPLRGDREETRTRRRPSLKEPRAEANLHWIVSRAFTSGGQCQPEEVDMIVKLAQQEYNDFHLYQDPGIFVTSLYARAAYREAALEAMVDTFGNDLFETDLVREMEAKRPFYLRDKAMERFTHIVSHQEATPEQRHIIGMAMREYVQDDHSALLCYVLEELDIYNRRLGIARNVLASFEEERQFAIAQELPPMLARLAEGRGLNFEALQAAQIGPKGQQR